MTKLEGIPAQTGHNSGAMKITPEQRTDESATGRMLRSYIERIERNREEIQNLKEDEKEIFKELKGTGFDDKIVKLVLKARAMDPEKRHEQEALLETYMSAIGM